MARLNENMDSPASRLLFVVLATLAFGLPGAGRALGQEAAPAETPGSAAAGAAEPAEAAETPAAPAGGAARAAAAAAVAAAVDDLTQPPEIDPDSPPPGAARLEPADDEREDLLEAVVTRGQTDWRLPDLGTSLRDDEDTLEPGQRIDVAFFPLFDPENQDPTAELFEQEELRRVEMIRIFEIDFGERD